MTGFIQNLIRRQTETAENVKPRVRGIFEPEVNSARIPSADDTAEFNIRAENAPTLMVPGRGIFTSPMGAEPDGLRGSIFTDTSAGKDPEKSFRNELSKGDDQKKEYKPSDLVIKPAPGLSGEETQVNNPRVPDQQAIFTNRFKNEYEREDYIGANQTNFPSDPDQLSVTNYTPRSSEAGIKPALKTAAISNYTPFANTRSASDGLLGTPPGLRNFSNTDAGSLRKTETPPAIKVTIGRIEVRAVSSPIPTTPMSKAAPKPTLSLDDYLQRRNERK